MKPIPIDLINITNQKRECGKEHKIQLANFDKASLGGYSASCRRLDDSFALANVIPLFLDNAHANCTVTRGTGQAGLCRVGNRFSKRDGDVQSSGSK
jgi:hypothetical protein